MDNLGAIIGLGVDLSVLYVLNAWYKSLNKTSDDIKTATKVKLDGNVIKDLADSKTGCIAYAYIEGEVIPTKQPLYSHHVEGRMGVIHNMEMIEHKTKSVQGMWTDVKKTIQDRTQMVPFLLRRVLDNGNQQDFHVKYPSDADLLMDTLTTTYDHFEPTGGGFLSRVVDRISGEVTKGYQETEKMLLNNTVLRGIGEVTISKGKLELRPPEKGLKYILTTMTRKELIQHYEKQSFWVKMFAYFTGVVGVVILFHVLRKTFRQFKARREREEIVNEIRRQREQNRNEGRPAARSRSNEGHDSDDNTENNCVVCLTNPREIVLLNCGHICLCVECLEFLPLPLRCPVCRQEVERYVTTYNP